MDTRPFRREHRTILGLACQLGGVAGAIKVRDDAEEGRAVILALDARIQTHLQAESATLYPALLRTADAGIRALAREASEETGGLTRLWADYRDRWTIEAVLEDAPGFSAATQDVLAILSRRIELENDRLFPALERLNTAGAGRTD